MCGTNDMTSGGSPGNATDTVDSGTFCGTVHDTILAIQTRFPDVPLGIITPVNRVDKEQYKNWVIGIARAIKSVCEQHSVPCLDLNACSGVLGFTAENIAYYYNDSGCHPNDAGHAMMAAKIEPFIKSLMPK
jgi:lysophospholipase L1-like esterase